MRLNNRLAIQLALVILLAVGQLQGTSDIQADTDKMKVLNLSYIWSVSGLESDQVIMALNQHDKDLYGAAKCEPDSGLPWNAIVIGSIDGNKIDLVLTYQENSTLISSKMNGSYDAINQSMQGEFFQVSDSKISKRGYFNAMWINPNMSDFIPATIKEEKPDNLTSTIQITNLTSNETVQQKSRYYDVHQEADSILTGVCGSGLA